MRLAERGLPALGAPVEILAPGLDRSSRPPGPPRPVPATNARDTRSRSRLCRVQRSRPNFCRMPSCRLCRSAHSFRARVSSRQNPSHRRSSTCSQRHLSTRRQAVMSTRSSSPGLLTPRRLTGLYALAAEACPVKRPVPYGAKHLLARPSALVVLDPPLDPDPALFALVALSQRDRQNPIAPFRRLPVFGSTRVWRSRRRGDGGWSSCVTLSCSGMPDRACCGKQSGWRPCPPEEHRIKRLCTLSANRALPTA